MNDLTVNDLSVDQREAYESIIRWSSQRSSNTLLTLGGYAGTGKSTLVSLVAEQFDLPAFCAYTGKASSVLRRKLRAAGTHTIGVQHPDENDVYDDRPFCGTIHSLIYRPCDCRVPEVIEIQKPCPVMNCDETLQDLWGRFVCKKGHGSTITQAEFDAIKPGKKFVYVQKDEHGNCRICGNEGWIRREMLDRQYGFVIVDEASMVTDDMLHDLRSYNVPILAVGDHGQLPPVNGTGSLMSRPNLRLEKIHRQAEGNPIIALSKTVREQGQFPNSSPGNEVTFGHLYDVERFIVARYEAASAERLLEMSIAVYKNKTRVRVNDLVRLVHGLPRDSEGRRMPPRVGEHLVCLRNMKIPGGEPVANGMRGVLTTDANPIEEGEYKRTHVRGSVEFPEDEIREQSYAMLSAQFGREKTFSSPEELSRETGLFSFSRVGSQFDFGYAMTVHKMQGSQFDDLLVCAEHPWGVSNEYFAKWAYTAVTRASKKLTVLK